MGRVLIIDDDSDIAALVSLKMGQDGHEVMTESDGASGLERARAERPDVVIVDWTLPSLTGPEICAALRADVGESAWVIMLTARVLDADGAADVGADELIAKPFSPRELSERVSAALAR